MSAPRRLALRVSTWVYRTAVGLRYPADLRGRYGRDMVDAFERAAQHAMERGGVVGLARLWWTVLRDLATPLPGDELEAREGRMGRVNRVTGWTEDLGFAVRSLAREPRFSLLVVGVLAVGIALNASAFAALNAYVVRPLPFPDPDRLVSVRNGQALSWNEVDDVFEVAVSWDLDVFTLVGDGRPEMAPGAWVTPGFLDAYGVRAQLGRTFRADEAGRDGAPVAMISHRLWQDRFAGDPDVIGRAFSAFTSDRPDHAELFTVVGVLPEGFWYFNDYTEVLAPIRVDRTVYTGRLRRDMPLERAETILTERAAPRLERIPPGFRVELVSLQEQHVQSVRPTLVVLQAAVLLVLLIACANAAVLLLVRSTRRERELGLRRALGASGGRLARQLLFEGVLLAAAATVIGLGLAVGALEFGRASMEARIGQSVPGGAEALVVDGTVALFAAALAAIVGLVFGLVPLASVIRGGLSTTLGEIGRGGSESIARRRARAAMVAAEVALSLALLTGAGLMVRSAMYLQRQPLGFDPTGVVRGQMGLREASYPDLSSRVAAFERIRDGIAALPGVEDVGLVSSSLFTTRFAPRTVEALAPDGTLTHGEAVRWTVDERYFEAMRIGMLRGRGFTVQDGPDVEPVAVVSERLARDLWGTADPIGRSIREAPFSMPGMAPSEPERWRRVVGVVSDVVRDVGGSPAGDVYSTFRQAGPLWLSAMVRARPGTTGLLPRIEEVVGDYDPEIPFATVSYVDQAVADARRPTRYLAALLGGFSAFALLLAVVGLYGVVAYAVRQRRRDVAIRIALGADRRSVTSLFVRQGTAVVLIGVSLGTWGGYVLGRALDGQLYGVGPGDPATHAVLATVLAVTAALAVWLPARRAAAAEPMEVLRDD